MSIKVFLDMDGTVFDLYNRPNWLDDLENERIGVFGEWGNNHGFMSYLNPDDLREQILNLIDRGVTFGIISWLPMGASPEYSEICRLEKLQWIKKNLPMITDIQLIPYGIEKQKAITKKASKMFLIDDNAEICKAWGTDKQRLAILVNDDFTIMDVFDQVMEDLNI